MVQVDAVDPAWEGSSHDPATISASLEILEGGRSKPLTYSTATLPGRVAGNVAPCQVSFPSSVRSNAERVWVAPSTATERSLPGLYSSTIRVLVPSPERSSR